MLPLRHSLKRLTSLPLSFKRSVMTDIINLRKGDYVEHNGKAMTIQNINSTHTGRGARSYTVQH